MGLFRRLKAWVRRTVVRIVLRMAHTRFARFLQRMAEVSAVPLLITGAGAFIGTGVASAAVLPLAYGALAGAGVALVGMAAKKLYEQNAVERRNQKRMKSTYTIWSRKEKTSAGRSYVVETCSPMGFF